MPAANVSVYASFEEETYDGGDRAVTINFVPIDKHTIDLSGTAQGTVAPNQKLELTVASKGPYSNIAWYVGGQIIGYGNFLEHTVPGNAKPGPYTITAVVLMYNPEKGRNEYFSNTLLFRVAE
jgi:hypothetical protein